MKIFILLMGIFSVGTPVLSESNLEKLMKYHDENLQTVLEDFPTIGYEHNSDKITIEYDGSKITSFFQGKPLSPGEVVPDKTEALYALFHVNEASGSDQTITVSGKFKRHLYVKHTQVDEEPVKGGCYFYTLAAAFFPIGTAQLGVFSVATNNSDVTADIDFKIDTWNFWGNTLNYKITMKMSSNHNSKYEAYVTYSLLTTKLDLVSAVIQLSKIRESEKLNKLDEFTCNLVN